MKTLSLYSGAGGIDLGFKKNKFHTLLAIESWDKACETLKANKTGSKIICDDIRNINFKDLKKKYKFDLIVGGPPCPPFSKSRFYLKNKKRGMDDEDTHTLINYFLAIKTFKPKAFFFENVHGFVFKPHKAAMEYFEKESKKLGYNISLLKNTIQLLYLLPGISRLIYSYVPIHLNEFFRDFESQTNLVNEANNCLRFGRFYKDNPFVIIPEIIQVSENTLLMSYEEGCRFDDLDETEYMRFKCITLLKLFIKNNELIMNFIHGDIHKGNWKVRIVSGKPQILIYDFGLCWRVPDKIIKHLSQVDTLFLEIDDKTIRDEDKFENMINGFHALLMERVTKDEIRDIVKNDKLSSDVMGILSQLLKLSKKTGYLIDSFLIQSLIIASQLQRYFGDYHFARNDDDGEEDKDLTYEYYRRRLPDIYCFCKTHNIFEDYQKHLEKEYSLSGIKVEGLFETIDQENNFNEFPHLKNMAIS